MRYLAVLLLIPLSGCWFFYVPSSAFQSGNACLPDGARVGQRVNDPYKGKMATVKEIYGRSERCRDGKLPLLADVEYD